MKSLDGHRRYYKTYPVSREIPENELINLKYLLGKQVVLIFKDSEVYWVVDKPSRDGYFTHLEQI